MGKQSHKISVFLETADGERCIKICLSLKIIMITYCLDTIMFQMVTF